MLQDLGGNHESNNQLLDKIAVLRCSCGVALCDVANQCYMCAKVGHQEELNFCVCSSNPQNQGALQIMPPIQGVSQYMHLLFRSLLMSKLRRDSSAGVTKLGSPSS
jgi:hypothetical protein